MLVSVSAGVIGVGVFRAAGCSEKQTSANAGRWSLGRFDSPYLRRRSSGTAGSQGQVGEVTRADCLA
jgi:hypothetical protein